ncbi:NifB/NifX family molybdenum-iron cluster-binding protein [Chloroflexota bacterium]
MEKGRIAVPSIGNGGLDGQRSQHFGHCDVFTLVNVENGAISKVTTVSNQAHQEGGCIVPVNTLSNLEVNALIVSGIGPRPLMAFKEAGIDVYYDSTCPEIEPVVESLIAGNLPLISLDQTCGGGGECQH